eukprot:TRINITY_DN4298_c0_g1_i5.p1 TRINITY_DN4298_c0_g1~~TRINITY_DN4298_c0_g1_i5.p1  ORF type:complete len:707 (-),score=73.38 TRINITY_DN4298_c0_g1_i5:148-2268(-)
MRSRAHSQLTQRVCRLRSRCLSAASAQRSWVQHDPDTDFPLQNLPFGVFSRKNGGRTEARCATVIGDNVVDLAALANAGLLAGLPFDARSVFQRPALNAFMALPRSAWRATRTRLTELLQADGDDRLRRDVELVKAVLHRNTDVAMHLPAEIGDYTDFYSSREHATNVGIMFRGKDNALQPNWLHLPVGYHGRASSVVPSGTPIVRPRGQLQADNDDPLNGSTYGPSRLLDIELEMGLFVGGPTPQLGRPITMQEAEDYIFGLVLLNDWSSRDIQKWEYVPLGPFGAKNFGTTISPWIVTLDALEPYRCETSAVKQEPTPLPYLQDPNYGSYDVKLEVDLITQEGSTTTISRSNFRHLYWNIKQQLVHHSVTGCNMKPGDLLGSGTISGVDKGSFGSMLELTWRGRDEIKLSDGSVRKFLVDYDTINLRGFTAHKEGQPRIGFGECLGQILPAGSYDSSSKESSSACGLFQNFTLHTYWRSSCSWRVRIALAYHNIKYEAKPVHLLKDGGQQKTGLYTSAVNAMAQVPSLTFCDSSGMDHTVTQSLAIIDFLDGLIIASGTGVPLVPVAAGQQGALRRARALEIAEIVNSGIQPHHNLATITHVKTATAADGSGELDGKGFAAERIRAGLAACEKLVNDWGGQFAVGNEVSIADLCIIPALYSARRFAVNLDEYPALLRVEAACEQLPCFRVAHPDAQPDAEVVAK